MKKPKIATGEVVIQGYWCLARKAFNKMQCGFKDGIPVLIIKKPKGKS